MRRSLLDQLPLVPVAIDHDIARELEAVSVVLDQLPEAVQLIHEDLSWRGKKRVDPSKGRHGMAAEQVLRVVVLKQMTDCSYQWLAFHLADSATYRTFCRLGFDRQPPKKATLQKNVKRVKPQTWETINRMVIRKAKELGIENGRKARTDCTVVESNIHHPTDSSLLWDSVRVLARLMECARDEFGIAFHDHRWRAKRRALNLSNAKNEQQRKPLYRDLLKVTKKTVSQAESTLEHLAEVVPAGPVQMAQVTALTTELVRYVDLAQRVIHQTERRVLSSRPSRPARSSCPSSSRTPTSS